MSEDDESDSDVEDEASDSVESDSVSSDEDSDSEDPDDDPALGVVSELAAASEVGGTASSDVR